MLELTDHSTRASKVAALALALSLATAAIAAHRTAGPVAALAMLAFATLVLLVTVIVLARRRLRRARTRLRLAEEALDAVPHAVFAVDAAQRGAPNLFVNAAYGALTGYAPRDAVQASFDAFSIFGDGAAVAALAKAQPATAAARVTIRHRDGTTFPAQLALRAMPHEDGHRSLVGTIEAVREDGRARNLEPQAATTPQAAGAESANGAFLAWLSHELRSPLNACVMWLDVLALGAQPDKLAKAVEAIKRGLTRQARLVNDLNEAARVSTGGLELRLERIDLIALIQGELESWKSLAIGKQLAFEPRIELASAPLDADPGRLAQALSHLIESAVASTPSGGGLGLRVHGTPAECVVEVEDTGAALSAEDVAHLAAPLWRSPTSAKARSGLGLGLAVAHHVATRHGGSLVAASGASGTRFLLTLPLAPGRGG